MPDWAWLHRELRRPNVTLALLWEEYRAGTPDGFGYSWFCDLYRVWAGRLKPTMRQTHLAGEKMFVDFAGRTGEVVDGLIGEIIPVQIFVAVLGASSFTYAEAVWSQKLPDWIAAHVRALAYFGGVPRQTVSDNLKAGITKACFHEPVVNRTYGDMARHYGTAIVPARPYKPRDKAKSLPPRRRGLKSASRLSGAGSWHGCGIDASSRWARSMRRSGLCSTSSTAVRCAAGARVGGCCSSSWINRRSACCRQFPTNTPNGSAAGLASTTMSRSPSITTACRAR